MKLQNINIIKKARSSRAFFSLLALTATLATAQQPQVWTESFDYNVGEQLDAHGWVAHTPGSSPMTVTNGLTFAGYQDDATGAALVGEEAGGIYKAFPAIQSPSVYVSFLVSVVSNYKSQYFVHLWDGNLPPWMGGSSKFEFNGRVYCGETGKPGLSFYSNGLSQYVDAPDLSDQQTRLFVIRYDQIPGDHNDQVSLYILDDMTDTEPATPTIGPISDSNAADITPAGFGLRANGKDQWIVVDGIRAADTWEKITGNTSALKEVTTPRFRTEANADGIQVTLDSETPVELYSLSGQLKARIAGKPGTQSLSGPLDRGMYLVKVGTQVSKITF